MRLLASFPICLTLAACFAEERAALRRAVGGNPAPAPVPTAEADPPGYTVPPEVTRCKSALAAAEAEVTTCAGRCSYPSYCCTIHSCSTVQIEAWAKVSDRCAEWGVTRAAGPILWPKANTGLVEPACDAVQTVDESPDGGSQ